MDDKTTQRLNTIARELERRKEEHGAGSTRSRTLRRFVRKLVTFVAFVFFVLGGIFIFNFLRLNSDLVEGHIKQGIIPNLTQGRFHLNIGAISGNLINGVELENVLIQNPHFESGSTLVTIPKVSMKYSLLGIFWGKITLEKLLIENPVLNLKRNETGRGIWDFSMVEDELAIKPDLEKSVSTWQKQEQAQALADNYLSDIRVTNLAILVPSPDEIILDEFLSRLIKLPTKTYQLSGINMTLKKYPAEKFVSQIFAIAVPENPDFLRFQFTRTKSNGNFTVTFDAIGQNFNFAVENLGLDGRKINLYDGRMKDRLNLEWMWVRKPVNLLEKIQGLTGVLRVPDLKDIFSGVLAGESKIEGSIDLEVKCEPGKCLYDADVNLKVADSSIKIPFMSEIQKFSAEVESSNRVANLKNVVLKVNDVESNHNGVIDFANEADIRGNITSSVKGDEMNVSARYVRENTGLHSLGIDLKRNSGEASIEFKRQLAGKAIIYRDFKIEAGLLKDGKAVEILPLNILPENLTSKVLAWFNRVELIGPLTIKTSFPTIDDWQDSNLHINFAGSKIVSKINPEDLVELNGSAKLASGVFLLEEFRADVANLSVVAQGQMGVATQAPYIKDYSLVLSGGVEGSKNFKITSERLQKSLGLKQKPDFDRVELKGREIFKANLSSSGESNTIGLNIDKLRFYRRKKPLWFDELKAFITTNRYNALLGGLPGPIDSKLSGSLFGIPLESRIKANLASGSIDELVIKGGGSNFSTMVDAIISQPEGRSFFKKYPMNISGAFSFAFLGKGLLKKPDIEGWIRFPSLGLFYRDVQARLPFYGLIKTTQGNYVADLKAGKASLKVGKVSFDLGKTSASAEVKDLFVAKNPEVNFVADSNIFATQLFARGNFLLSSKRIKLLKLALKSSKIEILAKEIARIGQFSVPFALSGKFYASANMTGSLFAPDTEGNLEISKISLDFPLSTDGKSSVLSAREFGGQASFTKKGKSYFGINLKSLSGKLLNADVILNGAAHLKRSKSGLKPEIDRLNAQINNLKAKDLAEFLQDGLLPEAYSKALSIDSGELAGQFSLSGNPGQLLAKGQASVKGASIGYRALKNKFSDISGILKFEGRSESAYAKIGIENVSTKFGRSAFKISKGYIEDPIRSGKLLLEGSAEKVFPKDLISMLGGMSISSISFPEEGWLDGSVKLFGTFAAPMISSHITSSKMTVAYNSGTTVYSIPLGNNLIDFVYNPYNGAAEVKKANFNLLSGLVEIDQAAGIFSTRKPFSFNLLGNIKDIDVSKLKMSDAESFKGLISGKIRADWSPGKARDAVFNLEFKNIFIPKIPVVDPASVAKVGIDFIEKPDFRVGQLNFYVTTEEDEGYAGKLLVADGLFAGPHMRLEMGNSEFNPSSLKMNGKLMLNPQSLRKTAIGRKLKRLSATIQDKKTGVPYIDFNLAGTWDKPELLSRSIERAVKKRAKRNYIKKLFGGRGPHKASVEELMKWFPGWKKGM